MYSHERRGERDGESCETTVDQVQLANLDAENKSARMQIYYTQRRS